ncbi:hypothetical protein [Amycolatopsis sp. H20-H5]|uniref:hypothetical protein n=1 Tax=Amycolatopsis sp. H20-H5 TaxID=3046309 RepID=UPI002DBAFDD7|nr:hypothetical protein [Amycolatopsis sp. H20-H5]MEC3980364.1 hypothetical protein [Amycolatopsis sp. H20-H5]
MGPDRIGELDADLILGLDFDGHGLRQVEDDPRFAVLDGVRAGNYRRLSLAAAYAMTVPSILTLPSALSVPERGTGGLTGEGPVRLAAAPGGSPLAGGDAAVARHGERHEHGDEPE